MWQFVTVAVRMFVYVQGMLGRLVQLRYPYMRMHVASVDDAAHALYTAGGIYLAIALLCCVLWALARRRGRAFDEAALAMPDSPGGSISP